MHRILSSSSGEWIHVRITLGLCSDQSSIHQFTLSLSAIKWRTFVSAFGRIFIEHLSDPPAKATMNRHPEYSTNDSPTQIHTHLHKDKNIQSQHKRVTQLCVLTIFKVFPDIRSKLFQFLSSSFSSSFILLSKYSRKNCDVPQDSLLDFSIIPKRMGRERKLFWRTNIWIYPSEYFYERFLLTDVWYVTCVNEAILHEGNHSSGISHTWIW